MGGEGGGDGLSRERMRMDRQRGKGGGKKGTLLGRRSSFTGVVEAQTGMVSRAEGVGLIGIEDGGEYADELERTRTWGGKETLPLLPQWNLGGVTVSPYDQKGGGGVSRS